MHPAVFGQAPSLGIKNCFIKPVILDLKFCFYRFATRFLPASKQDVTKRLMHWQPALF